MSCRICFTHELFKRLVSPCKCKGSMQWIHRDCLYLSRCVEGRMDSCSVCLGEYTVAFKPTPKLSLNRDYVSITEVAIALALSASLYITHVDQLLFDKGNIFMAMHVSFFTVIVSCIFSGMLQHAITIVDLMKTREGTLVLIVYGTTAVAFTSAWFVSSIPLGLFRVAKTLKETYVV